MRKLPLPFTIIVHGVAYDTGGSSGGVFEEGAEELEKHLKWTILRDIKPEVDVDMDVVFHEHHYREDWKTINDPEQD